MYLVFSHRSMDFDSLSAQLAVTKLYPGTKMVPAHPLGEHIKSFLTLHRDALPIVDLPYVDWDQVRRVFIVDCQTLHRLDDRAQQQLGPRLHEITYTVFDHHHYDENGLLPGASPNSICREVGAVTTILVEMIKEQGVPLSEFEATVLAAGIYEDTGSLTHRGTTAADAAAVAFLLESGAEITRVAQLIHPKLNLDQQDLFEKLLRDARPVTWPGLRVTICPGSSPSFIEGLSDITSKLLDATASDALISVVFMKDRIHAVCRSESPKINVHDLAVHFGGGGHPGASSAVIKSADVQSVARELEKALMAQFRPEKTAGEIMVSPVRTVRPDLSMDEAGRIMLRHSLDGLVVVENDEITGIVSKRDVDKAHHHRLGHARLSGFMSHPVITVTADATLSRMQQIMIREDIGRLPVVDDHGKLIGLVGRREIMSALYGPPQSRLEDSAIVPHKDIKDATEHLLQLDQETLSIYREIGSTASELGMTAYLVGGCVRDLLLDRPNEDLDFVVEGSAIDLARNLCGSASHRYRLAATHERFGTATLRIQLQNTSREVDIATARTEYYEYPAALPTVEPSRLEQDLLRRDFTINALAVNLDPDSFGEIVDFFDGITDLADGRIRILHPFSFIEDPTRIVRAAKFAARLGFHFEPRTLRQAQRAIDLGIFDDLGGVRLKEELRALLESPTRLSGLELLKNAGGGLRFLHRDIDYHRGLRLGIRRAERLLRTYPLPRSWIIYLGVLLSDLPEPEISEAVARLHLAEEEKRWITQSKAITSALPDLDRNTPRSRIYRVLHGYAEHSLAIAAAVAPTGSPQRRLLRLYFDELRAVKPHLSGRDILELGIPPGPHVGQLLGQLHDKILDGDIKGEADERRFLAQAIERLEISPRP